jgi:hypothetical protein
MYEAQAEDNHKYEEIVDQSVPIGQISLKETQDDAGDDDKSKGKDTKA